MNAARYLARPRTACRSHRSDLSYFVSNLEVHPRCTEYRSEIHGLQVLRFQRSLARPGGSKDSRPSWWRRKGPPKTLSRNSDEVA
jgi:hypothetical protein